MSRVEDDLRMSLRNMSNVLGTERTSNDDADVAVVAEIVILSFTSRLLGFFSMVLGGIIKPKFVDLASLLSVSTHSVEPKSSSLRSCTTAEVDDNDEADDDETCGGIQFTLTDEGFGGCGCACVCG